MSVLAWVIWGALAAAATPLATADTWPSWRGDLAQTGRSPSKVPDKLSIRWTYKAADAIVSSAVVDDKRVYFGSKDGGVGEHVRKESGEFRCRWTARFFCRSGFLRRA